MKLHILTIILIAELTLASSFGGKLDRATPKSNAADIESSWNINFSERRGSNKAEIYCVSKNQQFTETFRLWENGYFNSGDVFAWLNPDTGRFFDEDAFTEAITKFEEWIAVAQKEMPPDFEKEMLRKPSLISKTGKDIIFTFIWEHNKAHLTARWPMNYEDPSSDKEGYASFTSADAKRFLRMCQLFPAFKAHLDSLIRKNENTEKSNKQRVNELFN